MAIILDGTAGITTPGLTNTGTETIVNLTTTGNTTLGDATTDTLTVGVTGIVKDASGNVGIGTASPADNLHVVANTTSENGIRVQNLNASGQSAVQYYNNSGTQKADVWWNNNGSTFYLRTLSTDPMVFSTNNTQRILINGSGFTNFNPAGAANYFPYSETVKIDFNNTQAIHCNEVSSSSSVNFLYFTRGAANVATTYSGGIYWNGSTLAYQSASDYRLKENIVPLTGALAKVAQLKPSAYRWKESQQEDTGFIAHELQEVFPQVVSGTKDAVDEEGNPVYQGIDTSFLVATLTAAIQEQQALITALTARITTLENK